MVELTVLKNAGLNEKEAKVYLSLLELGSGTVQQIARHAALKRPTTYLVLDSLLKRDFAIATPSRGIQKYTAQDPEYVLQKFQEIEKQFQDLLPVFRARYARANRPQVKFYEGKEKLQWVYEHLIFSRKEIYFYGFSFKKFEDLFFTTLQKFIHGLEKAGTYRRVLELIPDNSDDIAAANTVAKTNPRVHQVRVLPKGKTFATDNAIAGDSVFIISLEKMFCVQITSAEVAASYRMLVEFAWESAKPIER